MSRGGRGGGGRSGKRGPDMSWDDETPVEVTPNARKPGPLFPERYLPAPKPLTASEKSSVTSLISFRDRMRRGPLYAVLDPTISQSSQSTLKSAQLDAKPSKPNSRAGFDPFNDQEKYTRKYHRKRRTIPDLGERGGYTLRLFPMELWPVLDPKHKMKEWNDLTEDQKARISGVVKSGKRKRDQALKFEDEDEAPRKGGSDSEHSDDEEVVSSTRKRKQNTQRRRNDVEGKTRQKKGLDAEDDYPDVDQQDEDAEGAAGEDEPHDSEFETDEDDDDGNEDDYNAERYFDDGADDMDGGGGGDEDGGDGYY